MSSFLLLLKTNLMMTFPFLGPIKKKKKRTKAIPFLVLGIFLLAFIFITFYLTLFAAMFQEAGEPKLILLMGISVTGLFVLFQTITKANVYLFRTKDYDMLVSLPVSNKAIILSKLVNLYIYNLVLSFTILFSSYFAYSFVNSFSLTLALTTLITTIFIPMIPMAVSSILAFLIGYISLPPKAKNIITTSLYLLLITAFFIFYMTIMNQSEVEIINQVHFLNEVFSKLYPLSTMIFSGMVLKSIGSNIIFITSSIICIAIFVFVVSRFYVSIHNIVTRSTRKKNYSLKQEKYKTNGEFKTLLKKELRLYFSIPSYVVNTIPGSIISIIGTIYFATQYYKAGDTIGEITGANITVNMIICIFGALLVMFMTLTPTTSSSISLENKSLWILKTSPINVKSIFLSKIALNAVISISFVIINLVILGIVLKANALVVLVVILATSLIILSFFAFGLYINICLPKFNFDNPIKAVKQSSSVVISLFASFIVEIVYFILTFVCLMISGTFLCLLVSTAVAVVLALSMFALLFTNGVKRFNRLSN